MRKFVLIYSKFSFALTKDPLKFNAADVIIMLRSRGVENGRERERERNLTENLLRNEILHFVLPLICMIKSKHRVIKRRRILSQFITVCVLMLMLLYVACLWIWWPNIVGVFGNWWLKIERFANFRGKREAIAGGFLVTVSENIILLFTFSRHERILLARTGKSMYENFREFMTK
jgi:hypothetical protein